MAASSSPRIVFHSGEFLPEHEATVSIFDSAVQLGDCVTESTRTFAHKPFRLDDHIRRLFRSLKVVRIDCGHTAEELTQITLDTLEANRDHLTDGEDCWIVHGISRGVLRHGPSPVQQNRATVMIYTAHLDLTGWARYYQQGCHAVTAMSRAIPTQSLDARIKNRSRMNYTICDAEARLVDPDAQVVLLDIHGNVSENKGGNVFTVVDGQLCTPSTDNCLAGISRQTALELAGQLGIPCRETRLQMYDLYNADEMFFTSTPYCIMPATRFNGLPIGDGRVGRITQQLLQAWSERVGVDIVAQAQNQVS